MDLGFNRKAEFTKWVVGAGLLTEPFILIDVGVQGGENIRWRPLGDHLVVHGFDPIEEVTETLIEENRGRSNRHYHCMALGDADGERAFNSANPTASSMYRQGSGRFDVETAEQVRMVPMRRLDSLLTECVIPEADFIKIDPPIRRGIWRHWPNWPWRITFWYPRASYQRALMRKGVEPISELDALGRPATVDVLFSRDLIEEVDHPDNYQGIKSMMIFELHALNDIALDTAERFAERLGAHLDVEQAVARRSGLPDERVSKTNARANPRIRAIDQLANNRTPAVGEDAGVRCACQQSQVG
jgi:FkbM family methyltransferase